MFVPLHDANPLERIHAPVVTWALIAVNVAIFTIFQSGLVYRPEVADVSSISYGLIPVVLFDKMELPIEYWAIPEWATPVTSAFLHGSWMHLLGNMLFLWVFGDNVEDALGHLRFLVFYFACAVLSGLAHAAMQPDSISPLIGASGAISGVIAAYLMLHPHIKLWVLLLMRIPVRITAMWAIGGWIGFQIVNAVMAGPDDPTAWFAHLGGLAAGAVLIIFIRPEGVYLFEQPDNPAKPAPGPWGGPPRT
jgi:membrane associated rhomboid family serine protease